VPLNIFVVVSLLTGVESARNGVMAASALMLAFSSIMTGAVIVNRVDQAQSTTSGDGNIKPA
jgi:MFS transporter, MFS domain-containing protein family, molybdate-anion transporter